MGSKHKDMNKILNEQAITPSSKQNSELVLPRQLNIKDEEEGHVSISDLFHDLIGVLSEAVTSSILNIGNMLIVSRACTNSIGLFGKKALSKNGRSGP